MAQDTSGVGSAQSEAPPLGSQPRFKDIMHEEWQRQKASSKGAIRGTLRQQIAMAISARVAEFWSATFDQIRRVRDMRRAPTRIETFEQACQRLKLSPQDLEAQFQQFRLAHWLCYGIGACILLWSFWLYLSSSWIPALGASLFAFGAMVNGYLYGFRAWQIQVRELAPLTKALKRLDSYLVI